MRNRMRRAIGAVVLAAAMLSAPAFGFIVTPTGQGVAPSPTLKTMAFWPLGGSVVTLLDVETNKTIGSFDAHFEINGVTFSTSGRFLCVYGPDPDFPVAIVDSQRHFRVTVSLKHPGNDNRYCTNQRSANGISPTLPTDSRSDSLIGVESYTIAGGPCGTAPRFFHYVLQYWDPRGNQGKLVAEYRRVYQQCS